MYNYSLKCAEQCPELFDTAHDFLLKHEKEYCALMERILNKESSVYLILKKESVISPCQVCGVFSFNRGRSFTSYIPELNSSIKKILSDFFKTHEVFCIVGPAVSVKNIEELLYQKKNILPGEVRDMYLMEYKAALPAVVMLQSKEEKIIKCSSSQAEKLFPLQVNFSREEVYPHWKTEVNLAAERFSLDNSIKNQLILAVENDGLLVSKAQTNAVTENYLQIGGVYTLKEHRGHGYACKLIQCLVNHGALQNKKTVLFVRKENAAAIHSYQKAGFKNFADYRMVYYK
ncbi:GNAT family N-acetyltransferase [Treponema sp.]|uniref:GNAT family N-acetyltransferase n=1 Tax=Treponema sp. TaxID=166 RepID=UPI0025D5F1D7|nr:GNAT family N-acetyltransferase [Treponema sp.]MCR5218719.1 GNAT family N-acetyltransferase [Treponema sp.]